MTNEQQRIAIAEACGYTDIHNAPDGDLRPLPEPWGKPKGIKYASPIPDYLNDLNEMHEAEKVLTNEQWLEYIRHLAGEAKHQDWPTCFLNLDSCRMIAEQTAAERAEAFLRTLNLWKD